MTIQNGVEDADEGTEAPDHDHGHRSNLERHPQGGSDGSTPGFNATAPDERASRIHRLHDDSDRMGGRDDGELPLHMPVPAQGTFSQVTHELTVRQSPWLPPDELAAYHAIDPSFAKGIIDTVQAAQKARIEAELIPVRAEAWALRIATFGVTFFPWLAAGLAVVFALNGLDTAALISGIFSATSGGVQIIQAVRRPKVVEVARAAPESTPPAPKARPKQVASKQVKKKSKKKRRR